MRSPYRVSKGYLFDQQVNPGGTRQGQSDQGTGHTILGQECSFPSIRAHLLDRCPTDWKPATDDLDEPLESVLRRAGLLGREGETTYGLTNQLTVVGAGHVQG